MKAHEAEIAIFADAEFLNVGDVVKDDKGEQGEVLGFSANGDPVVMFDSGERTVNLIKENLTKKSASWRPGVYKRPNHAMRIPLESAEKMGFRKVFVDRYEYQEDYGIKTAVKYPWDSGSMWKMSEDEDGKKFLVKEENIPAGDPDDHYVKNQNDNAGNQQGIGNSTDDFNILS